MDQSAGFIIQSSPGGFWIGLDPEICTAYHITRDLGQFLLIVTLTSEVLPSNIWLYTSSFVLTCMFYKVYW